MSHSAAVCGLYGHQHSESRRRRHERDRRQCVFLSLKSNAASLIADEDHIRAPLFRRLLTALPSTASIVGGTWRKAAGFSGRAMTGDGMPSSSCKHKMQNFDNAFDAAITKNASVKDTPVKTTPAKATTARRLGLAAHRVGIRFVLQGMATDTRQSRHSGRVSRGSFRESSRRSSQIH